MSKSTDEKSNAGDWSHRMHTGSLVCRLHAATTSSSKEEQEQDVGKAVSWRYVRPT